MLVFAKNLRKRAEELGLSNAEVARRLGLSERRYAHYVAGRNEPDLNLLIKIAKILETTPRELIGFDGKSNEPSKRTLLYDRLLAAAKQLKDTDLEVVAAQAEAVAALRKK